MTPARTTRARKAPARTAPPLAVLLCLAPAYLAPACLAPAAALAEASPAREALKRQCTGDYMEHCSAYAPGGPEVEACFKAKMKQLTPGCAAAITAYQREQRTGRRLSDAR